MNEPARYDDQGAWVPDDGNAMRGLAFALCFSGAFFAIIFGGLGFAWGWW